MRPVFSSTAAAGGGLAAMGGVVRGGREGARDEREGREGNEGVAEAAETVDQDTPSVIVHQDTPDIIHGSQCSRDILVTADDGCGTYRKTPGGGNTGLA